MGGKTVFDTRQSEYAKDLKRRREAAGDGIVLVWFLYVVTDVYNWKGPWAGYTGQVEEQQTHEETGEMTEWQRVWLQRNKDKKVREVSFLSLFKV